jgi:hypothetical protein
MKIFRIGDKIVIEEGEQRKVVLTNVGHNKRKVVLIRPGEAFYTALFEHFTQGLAGVPDTPQLFEAVFRHQVVGEAMAPDTTIGFQVGFAHAVVGIASAPDQPAIFEVAFTHNVQGLAGVPDGLVVFEAAFSQVVQGNAAAPDFVKFFDAGFSHYAAGTAAAADFSKLFNVSFAHFTEGVSAAPDVVVPGFDADYQAVLNYATSKGWTLPSAPQQTKGNQLVVDLKAAGIWSKLYFFYPAETDGDVNFACINWKAPADATNMTRINSPIYAVNQGFKGNGTSSYLEIPYNPQVLGFDQNNFAFGAYDLDNIAAGVSFNIADNGSTFTNFINPRNPSNDAAVRVTSPTSVTVQSGVTDSRGLHHMERDNSSTFVYAKNGVQVGGAFAAVSLPFSQFNATAFWLLRGQNFYSTRRVSMAFAGTPFFADRAAFNTAINTYRTGL